jgi:hypothetical protein
LPTGIAVNPGLTTGGFPTVTPSATSQLPTGAQRMSGPPGAPPPPPAPHGRSRYPTAGQAGLPGVSPGPTGASGFGAPRPAAYGPGCARDSRARTRRTRTGRAQPGPPGPTGPALGALGPTGPGPHHPGSHGPGPHGPTGPAHSAPSAWAPAPVQVTSPPRPASPMPYAPVSVQETRRRERQPPLRSRTPRDHRRPATRRRAGSGRRRCRTGRSAAGVPGIRTSGSPADPADIRARRATGHGDARRATGHGDARRATGHGDARRATGPARGCPPGRHRDSPSPDRSGRPSQARPGLRGCHRDRRCPAFHTPLTSTPDRSPWSARRRIRGRRRR